VILTKCIYLSDRCYFAEYRIPVLQCIYPWPFGNVDMRTLLLNSVALWPLGRVLNPVAADGSHSHCLTPSLNHPFTLSFEEIRAHSFFADIGIDV